MWLDELAAGSGELRESGRLRELRTVTSLPHGRAVLDGCEYLNLSGNDYLGLAGDPGLRREFALRYPDRESPELGMSSSSSRLLTGSTPAAARLEARLGELYGGRAALVFNSGYHANLGILPALTGSDDLIFSDKLNHASIIDGMRLADAEFRRYPHLDLDRLEAMLAAKRASCRRAFIVSESIFSMDGDSVDLARLVEIKHKYDAVLVVDEAHAVGVRGPRGLGLAAEVGVDAEIDVLIGTFGKALGSTGAYAVMAPEVREHLVNHMRPLIFSTALPPVILNWSRYMLEVSVAADARRAHLEMLASRLRERVVAAGFRSGGDSQIVPLLVGSDTGAVELARKLRERGVLVFPIRPPTVPVGTSRLRFSLTAALDMEDIELVAGCLS